MMRRPAGFVQKALRKTFHVSEKKSPAEPPRYWRNRFSNAALLLEAPGPIFGATVDTGAGEWIGTPRFVRHLLVKHQGRAASFLLPLDAHARKPASSGKPG